MNETVSQIIVSSSLPSNKYKNSRVHRLRDINPEVIKTMIDLNVFSISEQPNRCQLKTPIVHGPTQWQEHIMCEINFKESNPDHAARNCVIITNGRKSEHSTNNKKESKKGCNAASWRLKFLKNDFALIEVPMNANFS